MKALKIVAGILGFVLLALCGFLTASAVLGVKNPEVPEAPAPVIKTSTPATASSKDLGAGTPDAGCATNRLGKSFTQNGHIYTCSGPKPYKWRLVSDIKEDSIVHVGEDVPAGIYRVTEDVSGGLGCYWKKSSDSEGQNIIANDIVEGGKPQVTLKNGQWFTSSRCGTWRKK